VGLTPQASIIHDDNFT